MDDLYPDDGEDKSSSDSSHKSKSKKHDEDENTELVSKSFLHLDEDETAEEGKICKVRVVKDWGSECEIAYVKRDKKDKDDDQEKEEPMSADDELDEIDRKGGL